MRTYKTLIMGLLSLSFLSTSCQKAVSLYDKSVYKTYAKNGFDEKVLNANGHTVHYFDNQLDNKPTLLLVHGFGGDGKVTWERQIKTFRKDFRIVVPDLLWFGESHSAHQATLETQVDAIKTLIYELQLKEVHLVGISYGGFVTLAFASAYEKSLHSLTIIASPGNVIDDEEVRDFCIRNNVSDINEIFVPKDAEAVKRLFHISMVKPPPFPMVVYQAIFEKYFSRYPNEQEKLLDNLPTNKDKVAEQLTIPTMILWGEKDQIFDIKNAYKLQDKLNSQLVVHPTTGHTYPGEDPKHFNTELLKFIQSIEPN
jgi:pimeloyl-ACP methyl ester carboxylesterase